MTTTEEPFWKVILDYEVRSSWWACWVSNGFLQGLSARYFAWKVSRKLIRYKKNQKRKP